MVLLNGTSSSQTVTLEIPHYSYITGTQDATHNPGGPATSVTLAANDAILLSYTSPPTPAYPKIKGVSYYCGIAAWGLQWAALKNSSTSAATLARITSDMKALKSLGADTVSILLDANTSQCLGYSTLSGSGGNPYVLGNDTANSDQWCIYQVLTIVKSCGLQAYLRFDWAPQFNTGSGLTNAAAWMNQVNAIVVAAGVVVPGISLYNEPNNGTQLSTIKQGGSKQNGSLPSGFAGTGGATGWADQINGSSFSIWNGK